MGMYTQFIGTLTTSRPLTAEELEQYENELNNYYRTNMYLMFSSGSNDELEGPEGGVKVCGYVDMEAGFMNTVNWLKSKNITLSGRINYAYEDIFTEEIGGGFGAFVVTPECVTYHKLDFNGLQMISTVLR